MIWPFKKKKLIKEVKLPRTPGSVIELENLEELEAILKNTRGKCPEVMVATGACYCIDCPGKAEGCCVEKMAKSTGCTPSFPIYCTNKHLRKGTPGALAETFLKPWNRELDERFGLDGRPSKKIMVKDNEEIENAKKEKRGIIIAECDSVGPSGDTEGDLHDGGCSCG